MREKRQKSKKNASKRSKAAAGAAERVLAKRNKQIAIEVV
jgi:hypothetical protein